MRAMFPFPAQSGRYRDRMRKTREQSQQETRQRLIAAARAMIVRGGIGAVSLRGVCEQAGFTQGAFYSNFSSRDDLLLALMASHLHEEVDKLQQIVRSMAAAPLQSVLATLATPLAALATDTQWSLLGIELQLHAQRDSSFAAAYNETKAGYHTEFAIIIDEIVARYALTPALPSLQIAVGLYALWSGLVVQGTIPGAWPREEIFLSFLCAAMGVHDYAVPTRNGDLPQAVIDAE